MPPVTSEIAGSLGFPRATSSTGSKDAQANFWAPSLIVCELSHEHREVLQLAFFEELGYEEIASLLGIPENTVKTRVYYAKRQLKAHLT